jgi:hypothetical protein
MLTAGKRGREKGSTEKDLREFGESGDTLIEEMFVSAGDLDRVGTSGRVVKQLIDIEYVDAWTRHGEGAHLDVV